MWIKYTPDEFKVEEDSIIGHNKNNCTICTIERKNWDTTLLTKEIAKRIGISHRKIGYAGLKDKASHATQAMSFSGVDSSRLETLNIRDVIIRDCIEGDWMEVGSLNGNKFTIVVRDIEKDPTNKIENAITSFERWHGYVNYYGYQRFGLSRPVTADVGKYLVKKDYEMAAMTYIAQPYPLDPYKDIRKEIWDSRDFKRGYEEFPHHLRYERAMLFSLAHDNADFKSCFSVLPDRLVKLFVHAYQSKLFNSIVERRCETIEPNIAEEGDIIVTIRHGKRAQMKVSRSNIDKVNKMTSSSLSVAAPLIGYRTVFSKSTIGTVAREILEEENLSIDDFMSQHIIFSSGGSYREILARYSDFTYNVAADEIFDNYKCIFSFYLPKGQYATELLRQMLGSQLPPYRRDYT